MDRPRTTGELCDAFPEIGRTGVMKHLDVLESAGLIQVRREGRTRLNATNPAPFMRICLPWVMRHATRVVLSAQRLKEYAEQAAAIRSKARLPTGVDAPSGGKRTQRSVTSSTGEKTKGAKDGRKRGATGRRGRGHR